MIKKQPPLDADPLFEVWVNEKGVIMMGQILQPMLVQDFSAAVKHLEGLKLDGKPGERYWVFPQSHRKIEK